jgi:hypothetical protein
MREPRRSVVVNFPARVDDGSIRSCTGECAALAMWMTWKCQLVGLPFGGARRVCASTPPRCLALSWSEEHLGTRTAVSVCDLDYMAEFLVDGPDALALGQRLSMNDFEEARRGRSGTRRSATTRAAWSTTGRCGAQASRCSRGNALRRPLVRTDEPRPPASSATRPLPSGRRRRALRVVRGARTACSSGSASDVEWNNARLSRRAVEDESRELLDEQGNDEICFGGGRFAHSLSRHGLVDEYRLTVHPAALGEGLPLFPRPARALAPGPREQHRLYRRQRVPGVHHAGMSRAPASSPASRTSVATRRSGGSVGAGERCARRT